MYQKRIRLVLCFKKFLPKIFLTVSAKKIYCAQGHIFNKVNRGIVENPDAVGAQNWLGRWLLLSKTSAFCYI